MELWHEQRRRIKQGIAARNQATAKMTTATIKKQTASGHENKQALKVPLKETHTRQNNTKKVEPVNVVNTAPSEDIQKKTELGRVEKKARPLEEKQPKDKKDQKILHKKPDDKLHINRDKNYILINKHISPTETVAEFVLIPSPEFDRMTADSKAIKDNTGQTTELTKRTAREAWVELPVDEQKVSNSRSKPEEKVPTQLIGKVTDASTNTLLPLEQSSEDSETKAKPSKKELEQRKILNEKIKAKRNRIQQQLESVKRERESRNVGGRICIAAPETPVVYDIVSIVVLEWLLSLTY